MKKNDNNLGLSINSLKNSAIEMMGKCEVIVEKSVKAMVDKDVEASRKIIVMDDEIDDLRGYIREQIIELIALRQPLAKDLRTIYALSIMSTELERIGDYAVNIAMETIKIGEDEYVEELIDIPKMKNVSMAMLKNAKEAFKNNDAKLAQATALEDDIIDELYNEVYVDCIAAMHRNEKNISQAVRLLLVGRFLERIGDHITNICEMIIYSIKGEMIELD
ncbi:MAG: phosphate signaling complex protein PhoU [Terrisporobacter sp.]